MNYAPRVINYTPRVMVQIVASLSDDSKGIIYNYNVFIVQATDVECVKVLKYIYTSVLPLQKRKLQSSAQGHYHIQHNVTQQNRLDCNNQHTLSISISDILLSVAFHIDILSVTMLSVTMLSVMAPCLRPNNQ
jgi:hypothetical protein